MWYCHPPDKTCMIMHHPLAEVFYEVFSHPGSPYLSLSPLSFAFYPLWFSQFLNEEMLSPTPIARHASW